MPEQENARTERYEAEAAKNADIAARVQSAITEIDQAAAEPVQARSARGTFTSSFVEPGPMLADDLRDAFQPAIDAHDDMAVKIALVQEYHGRLRAMEPSV